MSIQKIFFLILPLLLITSCKNKVQKSYEFIKEYNNAAPLLKSNLIYRTEAKIIGERILEEIIIEIDYDLNLKRVDCENNIEAKMLPRSIYYALIKSEAGELINNGAIINLTFRSLDNYILSKITIDKEMMTQLLSQNQTHINNDLDFSSGKNPELIKILAKLNKRLPIQYETDRTKLLKLKLDKYNNIICITQVPDDFIRTERTKSHLRRENEQILMTIKETYGVSKIIYRYQNSNGKLIDQESIN